MRFVVLALVAACGGGHSMTGTDGGRSGSGDGQAMPDAPPVRGTVTAKLVDKTGAGVAGLHVVFIDTDATVLDQVTDASGLASASVFPGASVSAVHPFTGGGAYEITTVLAAVPGDTLTLDVDAFATRVVPLDTTVAGTFTVTFPASTLAGTNHYTIYTPCGGTDATTTTKAVNVLAGCAPPTQDLVVAAISAQGAVLGWTEAAGATWAPGGSATITDTWHPVTQVTETYSNVPASVMPPALYRIAPGMRGAIATATGAPTATVTSLLAAQSAMQTVVQCAGAGSGCLSNAEVQTITQLAAGPATNVPLDLGASLLPWVGTPVFHPNTNTMSVPSTGSGSYDLFEADLRYVRANTTIYTWRVFGPAIADVVFPALPSTVPGDPTLRSGDTMSGAHAMIAAGIAGGYRAAIGNVYEALGTCEASTSTAAKPPSPTTALVRFSRSN